MSDYTRDRNRIFQGTELVKEHKSINAAKRHSRELQASGHKVRVAKTPLAVNTPVEQQS